MNVNMTNKEIIIFLQLTVIAGWDSFRNCTTTTTIHVRSNVQAPPPNKYRLAYISQQHERGKYRSRFDLGGAETLALARRVVL